MRNVTQKLHRFLLNTQQSNLSSDCVIGSNDNVRLRADPILATTFPKELVTEKDLRILYVLYIVCYVPMDILR